jgi:hypothetical protein
MALPALHTSIYHRRCEDALDGAEARCDILHHLYEIKLSYLLCTQRELIVLKFHTSADLILQK